MVVLILGKTFGQVGFVIHGMEPNQDKAQEMTNSFKNAVDDFSPWEV